MGVFVAGVPSSLPPRTPFFSRVLAPLPFPRLRLLRRLHCHRGISWMGILPFCRKPMVCSTGGGIRYGWPYEKLGIMKKTVEIFNFLKLDM